VHIKIFGKQGCAKCKTTKNKIEFFISKWNLADKLQISFLDMDSVDGLSEAAMHDVLNIPATILEKDGDVLARWDGEVPNSNEFKTYIL
jgi:thiol-disulfide isomerase/thioredoxin